MRFQLIDLAKKDFPVHHLCGVLGVSQTGYFAWKDRPASRCQRDDKVMLAHVRLAFALSNGTHGSPHMTCELQDDGCAIWQRRTARLMRENGPHGRQKRRFKQTNDSDHTWPIAPDIIDRAFTDSAPNQKWGWTSRTSGQGEAEPAKVPAMRSIVGKQVEGGFTWRWSSTPACAGAGSVLPPCRRLRRG